MEILNEKFVLIHDRVRNLPLAETLAQPFVKTYEFIRSFGLTYKMDEYEKRKLIVFNQLNFFQLITALVVTFLGLVHKDRLPAWASLLSCIPSCISILVLIFNYYRWYQAALFAYFILYPFFTCIVYMQGINSGVELHFILYGILSVFFLQDIGYMIFTIALSMVSYLVLSVVLKHFLYQLEVENRLLYFGNQVLAIGFIFYGLFLIKKENAGYQLSILNKNADLHEKNLEIEHQREVIAEKAELLEKQRSDLSELNALKNKLFSVIAHDLKAPMYAVRNLFQNIHQQNMPAEEIKHLVPDIMNELHYTTSLMENLLQWAKSQMQGAIPVKEETDVSAVIKDVINVLHLQATDKNISIENNATDAALVLADREMISLVIRNLVSNALKFTPHSGKIIIGMNQMSAFVEVYVKDFGTGISQEAIARIHENNYFTTKGTASESGTGLGLMLCKEFLVKNGGIMHIESEEMKGSTFSFTLPRAIS